MYLGTARKKDLATFVGGLSLSLLLFYWHLHESWFLLHIALFYPVVICFIFGVLSGCKLMDGIKSSIITNLSIGTLVIVGLHYPIVSLVNFGLEHLLKIDSICYQWHEALFIALGISAFLYFQFTEQSFDSSFKLHVLFFRIQLYVYRDITIQVVVVRTLYISACFVVDHKWKLLRFLKA